MNRPRSTQRRQGGLGFRPTVDPLEGRTLLSGLPASPPRSAVAAAVFGIKVPRSADGDGTAAILSAFRGGPGSEFVRLIRPQVSNPAAILRQFQSGQIREFAVRGAIFQKARFLDGYTGPRFDQHKIVAAGAVVLSDRRMELGAIVDGPIDAATTSVYTFGFDRGGADSAPIAGLPTTRVDALVTVVRDASGRLTGTIRDLKTGSVTPLASRAMRVTGPTLRVRIDPKSLPSTGATLSRYRFAFATASAVDGGAETLAAAAPSTGTIAVGDLRRR